MKLFLMTGPEYPMGHPDDQKLFHECSDLLGSDNIAWIDWRGGGEHFGGPGDKVLVRTPWDYQSDARRFLAVLQKIETRGLQLFNPYPTIAWNLDKKYLSELANRGIPVVPTLGLEDADSADVVRFVTKIQAQEWILKPRVGASASGIRRIAGFGQISREIQSLPHREFLLQPMIDSVKSEGEISLLYYNVDGQTRYSHASLKVPKAGDFRVQTDFGGTDQAYQPSDVLIAAGGRWLSQMGRPWFYARVDILDYRSGTGLLGEIELIEPQLFHRFGERSEELLMRAIGLSF